MLRGKCHRREEGWWHYEVCHGEKVTQYHPKPVENCVGCLPVRDPQILLGSFLGAIARQPQPQEALQESGETWQHEFGNGDKCGANNQPRTAAVHYQVVFLKSQLYRHII